MTKWHEVKLAELATIKYGKNQKDVAIESSNIPIYGTGGIMGYASKALYDKPSVLIGRKGTIDKVRYVTKPFWTVDTTFYTIINENKILPRYFYYLLTLVDLSSYNEGTTIPSLRTETLNRLEFMVPSLDIQKKIAGVLGALDDKIELNNRINNNLEQQAQALFKQYFPDIISGNKTIGDYLSPKRGKNLLSKDAVIGVVPVIAGGLSPATYHNQANTAAPVITISASGANAGYVNLWHIPVWSSDSSFIDTSITPYVYFWYIVLKIRQQEIFEAQTGSAQPHIYPQHIENMPIKEINLGLVKKYNEDATPLYMLIGHNQQENTRLVALRDALLPKLMSGEIDVSKVDINELNAVDKLL